jgi:hypothetical protein
MSTGHQSNHGSERPPSVLEDRPGPHRVVAAALVACGVAWAGAHAVDIWNVRDAARWPTVPGHVTSAEVTTGQFMYPRRQSVSRCHIRYTYVAQGRALTGWRIDWRRDSQHYFPYHECGYYRVGLPVTVHYDPTDPIQTVLDPSLPPSLVVGLCLGVAVAIGGLALFRHHPLPPLPLEGEEGAEEGDDQA